MNAFLLTAAAIYLGIALRDGVSVAARSLMFLPLGGLVWFGLGALLR